MAVRVTVQRAECVSPACAYKPEDENYALTIDARHGVDILAASVLGANRAFASLASLASPACDIPCLPIDIKDGPRFGYRGVLLDTARNCEPDGLGGWEEVGQEKAFNVRCAARAARAPPAPCAGNQPLPHCRCLPACAGFSIADIKRKVVDPMWASKMNVLKWWAAGGCVCMGVAAAACLQGAWCRAAAGPVRGPGASAACNCMSRRGGDRFQ